MSNKKYKELEILDEKARQDKLKELRLELIKRSIAANKASKGKVKEIKKTLARLLTVQTKVSEDGKR